MIKHKLTAIFLLIFSIVMPGHGQKQKPFENNNFPINQLVLQPEQSVHILSPEDIKYVDISSNYVIGDLPLSNVLRLKLQDSIRTLDGITSLGALTIVGQSYLSQFNLQVAQGSKTLQSPTLLEIGPKDIHPLQVEGIELSSLQMRDLANRIIAQPKARLLAKRNKNAIGMVINSIHAVGECIFLDISLLNNTNLPYSMDELRFFIEDKKIVKTTNVQRHEIIPIWQLHPIKSFKKRYRNIIVINKLTFPGNKVLRVSLTETQPSSRAVDLKIKYEDILHADYF